MADKTKQSFFSLTPEIILESLDGALSSRPTGQVVALNSLENRVHQIELEDGSFVVSKFYRPQRWNQNQILEEHRFLKKLNELEIPAVAPLILNARPKFKVFENSLGQTSNDIFFAVFPKIRGRLSDELTLTQLQTLGRYLARIHRVGQSMGPSSRPELSTETYGWKSLDILDDCPQLKDPFRSRFMELAEDLLERIEPLLESLPTHLIHGDCHSGNILWDGDQPHIIDFDDMLVGPAVQDLWLLFRGRDEWSLDQREKLIAAYEVMNEFDRSSLQIVEALRALRIIRFSGWIAERFEDPSFQQTFPQFGEATYWNEELNALYEIRDQLAGV